MWTISIIVPHYRAQELSACQSIYNVCFKPPQRMICDLDGTSAGPASRRYGEVFEERMRAYGALTTPVVEHYRTLGRLRKDGDRPIAENRGRIVAAVERLRQSA